MFLAVRDLRFARGRFALTGTVVALIAVLGVLLSGMASGLTDSGISGLRALPLTHFAFASGASGELFSRSTVDRAQWTAYADRPGVRAAAPFGNTLVHATVERGAQRGRQLDLAVFGVEPGSFLDPAAAAGSRLATNGGGILISRQIEAQGVRIGDRLGADQSGVELPVVGTLGRDASYGHVAVVFANLTTWQRLRYGLPGALPEAMRGQATAVALKLDAADAAASADRALGLRTVSLAQSYAASPGYSAESGTMSLISGFLYVISALVVGSFFTVWTVQRRPEIALLKALGASTRYVLRDAFAQAAVVLVLATALGTAVGLAVGGTLLGSAPFSLQAGPVASAAASLVLLGLLGALVAVRRITAVDPLTALGAN